MLILASFSIPYTLSQCPHFRPYHHAECSLQWPCHAIFFAPIFLWDTLYKSIMYVIWIHCSSTPPGVKGFPGYALALFLRHMLPYLSIYTCPRWRRTIILLSYVILLIFLSVHRNVCDINVSNNKPRDLVVVYQDMESVSGKWKLEVKVNTIIYIYPCMSCLYPILQWNENFIHDNCCL